MPNNQRRACGLIRVSSEEQAKGGYGLEFQERDVRTFCERNNLDLVKIFRDEGYSGASTERPGFQEMMEWARRKKFDVLVVWKLDRLFRDTKLTLQTVDELASLDIEFRSVQETFTHDSNGRFLLTIFAAGAEKERKDIALRMSAGRIASARRGTWINGSVSPYGYRYNGETKRLEIDEQEAQVVRKLFKWLVTEKLSLYRVQFRLNELHVPTKFDRLGRKKPTGSSCWWSKRTIGRILANEVYTGTFTFRKYRMCSAVHSEDNLRPEEDWITVRTPAIISRDLFRKAREQLKANSANSPRRTKELYILRGLLVCGHDGRRMQAARRPANGSRECKYYFCSGIRKYIAPVRCPSRSVSESRVAPPVWKALKQLLLNPEIALAKLTEYQRHKIGSIEYVEKKTTLEAQRKKIAERTKRLVELYLGQAVDKGFFQTERQSLTREADEIEREVKKLNESILTHEEMMARARTIRSLYARYRQKLEGASDVMRREIVSTFVKNVVVRGEELEMEVALPNSLSFAGQPPRRLSRKDTFSVFLTTQLVPISQIFKDAGIHRNLGPLAQKR